MGIDAIGVRCSADQLSHTPITSSELTAGHLPTPGTVPIFLVTYMTLLWSDAVWFPVAFLIALSVPPHPQQGEQHDQQQSADAGPINPIQNSECHVISSTRTISLKQHP